jgi:predicted nucleic acid-binding protein
MLVERKWDEARRLCERALERNPAFESAAVNLADAWIEIEPGLTVRARAQALLLSHPLRAADSFQLAAALLWAGPKPTGQAFVCLDQRLRAAARNEGFKVLPENLS